jgi:helicase required for RNAi-mediated heterochromatin assembly 1
VDKALGASASPQQLISVGDHQQLQAGCTVRAVESPPYVMDTSMFKRLVKNLMRYVMLNKRRRMVRCSKTSLQST